MRDFVIVIVLALAAAFFADRIWFGGKYFGSAKQDFGWDISSARRH